MTDRGGPEVSIIVNVYNGARYVAECLRSVLALRGAYELEVIVADDASTDATPEIVRAFDDRRITYLRHERNRGAAVAINHAFERVTAPLVARIDYDDRYRPDFLEQTVPIVRENGRAGMTCGAVQMIDEHGQPTAISSPLTPGRAGGIADRFAELLANNFITAPTILARADLWRRALPLPAGMHFCDWYMNLCMAEVSGVAVIDRVLADYRVHPMNMHATMVKDGSGERITWEVLDRFFGASPRRAEIAPLKAGIYARHHREWGDRYFGAGLYPDARRCYLAALARQPQLAWRGRFLHRLAGTMLGRGPYEKLKRAVRIRP